MREKGRVKGSVYPIRPPPSSLGFESRDRTVLHTRSGPSGRSGWNKNWSRLSGIRPGANFTRLLYDRPPETAPVTAVTATLVSVADFKADV